MHALKISETKITSIHAFINNVFALKRDKQSEIDRENVSGHWP